MVPIFTAGIIILASVYHSKLRAVMNRRFNRFFICLMVTLLVDSALLICGFWHIDSSISYALYPLVPGLYLWAIAILLLI